MRNWRINFIFLFFILVGVAIIGRLFFIQVLQGDFYKALARGLMSLNYSAEGERGEVFFKNGEYLAINRDWPLIFTSPKEITDKGGVAKILAEVLDLNESQLLEKINQDNLYLLVKKRVSEEELDKLKELALEGVYFGKESGRFYPQETLASGVVGFLGAERTGQYGVEEYYDKNLQPKGGGKGNDLVLTLDYAVQFYAEKLLESAKEELDIEGGEIIVIEPDSGKIMALANFPNFNPNQYFEVNDFNLFQNGATQKIFEPGSVFKAITMASAIEEEKITPETTYIDQGSVKIGGRTVYNYDERIYGEQTMTGVLEKSINTGAVFAEKQLGHNLFLKHIEEMGIFEPTGIDVQETYSENKEFKKGYEINFATASFGQGIEMTPMQLIRAYSSIANGGKLITPYLVEEIRNGENVETIIPEIQIEQVVSSRTSSQVTAMLVSVTENGFSKAARVPGYYIAGKTGTAQISYAALGIGERGYSDKTWQVFIGFAPAFSPRFLILVKLDNPDTKTAEYSAIPVFQKLAKYIIDYYQIPPDYDI